MTLANCKEDDALVDDELETTATCDRSLVITDPSDAVQVMLMISVPSNSQLRKALLF